MKKSSLFALLFGLLAISLVYADITPPNSHPLNRCVKFVNLNEFPNVILIEYRTGPTIDNYEAYQVQNNVCLDGGYKFNSLNIYWTTKEKFSKLDLKNLNLVTKTIYDNTSSDNNRYSRETNVFIPKDLTLLLKNVAFYGGNVDKNNPLIKETVEYSIAYSNKKLIAYKSKQISEYNNGQTNKIEVFNKSNSNNEEPVPIPKTRSFWAEIGCFFEKLFGGNC